MSTQVVSSKYTTAIFSLYRLIVHHRREKKRREKLDTIAASITAYLFTCTTQTPYINNHHRHKQEHRDTEKIKEIFSSSSSTGHGSVTTH
jgi:hypothetical protein